MLVGPCVTACYEISLPVFQVDVRGSTVANYKIGTHLIARYMRNMLFLSCPTGRRLHEGRTSRKGRRLLRQTGMIHRNAALIEDDYGLPVKRRAPFPGTTGRLR